MYDFGCDFSGLSLKLVINDLFAPASALTTDDSYVDATTVLDEEDRLNDSLADAFLDFRRNGGDNDSFNSGTDL